MQVQTRSETRGLAFFPTLAQAMFAAQQDPSIWKISFTVDGEQVRLIRDKYNHWLYEPL